MLKNLKTPSPRIEKNIRRIKDTRIDCLKINLLLFFRLSVREIKIGIFPTESTTIKSDIETRKTSFKKPIKSTKY